ncbi:MAG: YbaB/EbfC family nucleoid-associated protein [Candidatus Cloacimonetes bacterium]|nr:YbaB/EbfC family nucleoid-associated protein [Candidatus Cloacimonadota bacterium]
MFPGGKNMNQLMKQAQKMQQEMAKSQEELKSKEFEVSSGGGMVKLTMNGEYEIQALKIDPEAVDPSDVEMLEDLILAALKEAHKQVSEASGEIMNKLTGGMKIPGLF